MRIVAIQPSSKKDLLDFITFPLNLYGQSPCYVPHLIFERKSFFNPRKNPFFNHAEVDYFLALSEKGDVLGRISAHIDWKYINYHGDETGFFGFFDCVDDRDVASSLLESAADKLRSRGMKKVMGPLNFTTNDEVGVLVSGFDSPPFIMMPYNYPYYCDLLEESGFRKAKDLFAYYIEYGGKVPESIERVSRKVRKRSDIVLRPLDMKRFESELRVVRQIYNSAWEHNWGFRPMADEEMAYLGSNLKQIVDPRVALFAYSGGKPVGFFIAIPDYNVVLKDLRGRLFPFGILKILRARKRIDRLRVLVLGVVDEHRRSGIESVLLEEIFLVGPRAGYLKGELSWILEDNVAINRILSRFVEKPYKIFRIYEKEL